MVKMWTAKHASQKMVIFYRNQSAALQIITISQMEAGIANFVRHKSKGVQNAPLIAP